MERTTKCHNAKVIEMLRMIPIAPDTIRKCQLEKLLGVRGIEAMLLALPSWIPLGSDKGELCYISEVAKKDVMTAYGIDRI